MPKKHQAELKEGVKIEDEVLVKRLMRSVRLLEKSSEEIRQFLKKA